MKPHKHDWCVEEADTPEGDYIWWECSICKKYANWNAGVPPNEEGSE